MFQGRLRAAPLLAARLGPCFPAGRQVRSTSGVFSLENSVTGNLQIGPYGWRKCAMSFEKVLIVVARVMLRYATQ